MDLSKREDRAIKSGSDEVAINPFPTIGSPSCIPTPVITFGRSLMKGEGTNPEKAAGETDQQMEQVDGGEEQPETLNQLTQLVDSEAQQKYGKFVIDILQILIVQPDTTRPLNIFQPVLPLTHQLNASLENTSEQGAPGTAVGIPLVSQLPQLRSIFPPPATSTNETEVVKEGAGMPHFPTSSSGWNVAARKLSSRKAEKCRRQNCVKCGILAKFGRKYKEKVPAADDKL